MPASFITLPTEVSLLIIRNVEKSGWLLDLALCCRSLYYLTLPCLYTDVKLLFEGFNTGFLSLIPFTTHMLKNPVLASHVHGLAIEERWSQSHHLSSEPRLDETVREVISRSSISQWRQEKWMALWNVTTMAHSSLCFSLPCRIYSASVWWDYRGLFNPLNSYSRVPPEAKVSSSLDQPFLR